MSNHANLEIRDPFEEKALALTGLEIFVYREDWRFTISRVHKCSDINEFVYLHCYKKLHNPENPGEDLSFSYFTLSGYDNVLYRRMPEGLLDWKMREAAAWLVAHWYEHYFNICPCIANVHDDEKGSLFRQGVIRGLLYQDLHPVKSVEPKIHCAARYNPNNYGIWEGMRFD